MPSLRLTPRLLTAAALPLAVAVLVAFMALRTVAEVRPGSERAADAVTARQLAASLRAPGEFLLEAYAVALQLPTVDPAARAPLLAQLDELRAASEADRRAWIERLPEGGLQSALEMRVGGTAQNFWAMVDGAVRPAAGSGTTALHAALAGPLAEAFARHTEAVDEVARLADERAASVDAAAGSLADRRRWLLLGAFVVGATLAVAAMVAIVRSVTRRAGQLRDAAMGNADALRDSEAVPGRTPRLALPPGMEVHDELGEAAAAVGMLVEEAGRLAADGRSERQGSADVFVNLGRRTQGLVTRQLQLLDELERTEPDPGRAAALARLDHLAGCLRRNAESLLVLAGLDPPQRGIGPLDLEDIARAAAAETEPVDRVHLGTLPPLAVTGAVAAPVIHLLAELIDNALRFSSPQTTVTVTARQKGGGLVVGITDEGVGMTADALEDANALLAAGGWETPRGPQLGHVVIGRLAVRHGFEVELDSVSGEGLTAWVTIPADAVEPSAGRRRPSEPPPTAAPAAVEPPTVAALAAVARAGTPTEPAGAARNAEPELERVVAAGAEPELERVVAAGVASAATADDRAAISTAASAAAADDIAPATASASAKGARGGEPEPVEVGPAARPTSQADTPRGLVSSRATAAPPAARDSTGGRPGSGATSGNRPQPTPPPDGTAPAGPDAADTTPSGFRRRVPRTRRGDAARPDAAGRGGRSRQLRPLDRDSATERKARLDSFVAGRSTAGEVLGLEDEATDDDTHPSGNGDVDTGNGSGGRADRSRR